MKVAAFAASALMLLAGSALLPVSAETNGGSGGTDLLEHCLLDGGEVAGQPSGSPIIACCTHDGCVICDSAPSGGCHFDPAYSETGGGGSSPQFQTRNDALRDVLRQ